LYKIKTIGNIHVSIEDLNLFVTNDWTIITDQQFNNSPNLQGLISSNLITYQTVTGPDDQTNQMSGIVTANLGTLNGAALDSSLQSIKSILQAQLDFTNSIWTDNSGAFYIRREIINEETGAVTVSYETPAGVPAIPGAGLAPIGNTSTLSIENSPYTATNSGTGYNSGDILVHVFGISTATSVPTLLFSFWFNATSGVVMSSAPTSGTYASTIQPVSGTVNVSNLPTTQPVSGTVNVSNLPTIQPVSGTVNVSNLPTTQPVSGIVSVSNLLTTQPVSGTVSVSNLPTTQAISGTVSVSNLPTTQAISGTVNIASNQNIGLNSNSNVIGKVGVQVGGVDVSAGNQIPTNVTDITASVSITRPANVTAYAAGGIINASGASTLPTLSFGGGYANRHIQINSVAIISTYGASVMPVIANVHLMNVNNPTSQTVTDATAWNPTATVLATQCAVTVDAIGNLTSQASNAYKVQRDEMARTAVLDASGDLYPAIVAASAYTPASGEQISIIVKATLLN